MIFSSKCSLNTFHLMTRGREGHRSFYGCGRIRRRLSPRPPQWIPILGFLFCFVRNNPTNEQTNKQTGLFRFVLASQRIHPAAQRIVLHAVTHERGKLEIEFGFRQNQKLIWFWGMPLRFCWRAWRSYDHRFAFADALGPSRATTNKKAMPPGTYLIVYGSDDPDFHSMTFCHVAIVCSAPRSSKLCPRRGEEGSIEIVGL